MINLIITLMAIIASIITIGMIHDPMNAFIAFCVWVGVIHAMLAITDPEDK